MPSPSSLVAQVAANWQRVQASVAEAANQAGRSPNEITIVGVTKYASLSATEALLQAGCCELGESRPQSLWEKGEALRNDHLYWHMIGHWQRNKVRRALPYVSLLHAGDSLRLLHDVNEEAARIGRVLPVLLEVNISGDATKHGFAPTDLPAALPTIATLANLRVRGLMGMASLEGDAQQARREFAQLRLLRDELRQNCPANLSLDELSMGMSGDYAAAIAEGATLVRIGSALWEGIDV
jgi:PLP dependent protein